MLRQVLRELRFHPSRFVATVIAIAISVAFMAGSSMLVATENNAAQRQQALPIAGADVVVTLGENAGRAQRATLRSVLDSTPGVLAAEASLTQTYGLRHGRATLYAMLIGVPSEPFRWAAVEQGRWPDAAGELVLTRGAAGSLGVGVGDTVTSASDSATLTVVGLTGEPNSLFLQTGYLAPAEFARLGVTPAEAGTWIVKGAPGSDPEALAGALETALASATGVKVQTADAVRAESMKDFSGGFDAFRNLLWAFAAIAAVVGMITIANTFTILLAQRRRQTGLLRAVGASGAQVRRRYLLEAVALGVLGAAFGLLLGAALAATGAALTGSLFWGLVLPGGDLAIAFAAGVAITVVAAYVPVLRGTRVRPLEALQPEPAADEKRRAGIVRGAVCGTLVVAGVATSLWGLGHQQALLIAIGASILVALGVLFAAPLFVPLLLRAAGAGVRGFGVTARLAAQNAVRNPRRASSTATALMLAVGLIVTLQVATASIRVNVLDKIDEQRPVDVAVSTWGRQASVPRELIDALKRIPGVDGGVALASAKAAFTRPGESFDELTVLGHDPAMAAVAGGAPATIGDDQVYVSDNAEGAEDGQRATLRAHDTRLELQVVTSPLLQQGEVMVSRANLDALGGVVPDAVVWLSVPNRADGLSVATAVTELAHPEQYELAGTVVEAAAMESVLNLLLTITTALLGVAVLIALIGVSNTLGLSVLERTRESALMRALGLQARSLRLMLLIEALLLAGVGVVVGIAAGIWFGWLGSAATASQLKAGTRLVVDLPLTLGMVVIAVLAAALASVLPGRRAAKASPTEALADL